MPYYYTYYKYTCELCGKEFTSNCVNRRFCSRDCLGASQRDDITGQVFGRLTVIKPLDEFTNTGRRLWLCQCECGNLTKTCSYYLRIGDTKSCGCAKRDREWKLEEHPEQFDGTNIGRITSKKLNIRNKSGVTGVALRSGRWIAQIGFRNKTIHLGQFDTLEEAAEARREAEELYFAPTIKEFYQKHPEAKPEPGEE